MNTLVSYIFPIFSTSLGILILAIVAFLHINSRDIDTWQRTQGRIIKSRIKRNSPYFYSPEVHFEYNVNGIEYRGLSINLNGKLTNKSNIVQTWITPYPVGKEVEVFYNPVKPQMAVLEKSVSIGNMIIVFLAGIFLIASGLFSLYLNFIYQ